jgi:REP element-mobilizing transposase RayT
MTSPSPLLYDICYHIYNRGVNREDIFIEERNYSLFLRLFERHLSGVVDLYAYCLLKNHFHILVRVKSEDEILETRKTLRVSTVTKTLATDLNFAKPQDHQDQPEKPLGSKYASDQFSNFFNAYAKTINQAYGRTGSLFQHPFGRVPITTNRQFWNVIAYVHQNPQKHGFAHSRMRDFREWKYSSYGVILTPNGNLTPVNRSEVMRWFGTMKDYVSLHSLWVTDVQAKWFPDDDD